MVAALFRTIFAQPDRDAVWAAWEEVRDQLVKTFPKVGPLMDAESPRRVRRLDLLRRWSHDTSVAAVPVGAS